MQNSYEKKKKRERERKKERKAIYGNEIYAHNNQLDGRMDGKRRKSENVHV